MYLFIHSFIYLLSLTAVQYERHTHLNTLQVTTTKTIATLAASVAIVLVVVTCKVCD